MIKRFIFCVVLALSPLYGFADNYDRYDGWSATLYGLSHHATQNQRNPYKEFNPGFGIRKHFGECFWQSANCFAELSYIHKNSLGGKVKMLSAGSKWTLATLADYRIHVGGTITYLQYENPLNRVTYHGVAPIPFVGIGKNSWDLDVSILSKKPLAALTGKDDKAVFLIYFVYRF